MKRWKRNLLVIAYALILAGCIPALIGSVLVGFHYEELNLAGAATEKTFTSQQKANAIKTVSIETGNADITVKKSNGKQLRVQYTDREKRFYSVDEKAGSVAIQKNTAMEWYEYLNFFNYSHDSIVIELPEGFTGSLELKTSNGFIEMTDQNDLADLVCSTSNGPIRLRNVASAKSVSCETSNGDILLMTVTAKDALKAKTSNSPIEAERIQNDEIELQSSNGSITGTILGKMEDYVIRSSTSNGNNTLPERTTGSKKLTAETSNGSIELFFTES